MSADEQYRTLILTPLFVTELIRLRPAKQRRIVAALDRLDENERHPSLRVHQLQGQLVGVWSASASDSLRITFVRLDDGRKAIVGCSRHYGD